MTSKIGTPPEKSENKRVPHSAVSKREPERKGEEKGSPMKYLNITIQFLREARMELKKVKWPTRKELLASTAVVIVLVLVVSFFLGLVDFGLIKIIKNVVG
ncbi:MAG: preprotein translocase subunit SecE [Pseudomonadota bacterium]